MEWSREVEVEAKLNNDVLLKINQLCLGHVLLLVVWKQLDHSVEAGRNRLLQLSGHQYTDYCKVEETSNIELISIDHGDVMIENTRSDKKSCRFVIFLLMQMDNFLDCVHSVLAIDFCSTQKFYFLDIITH